MAALFLSPFRSPTTIVRILNRGTRIQGLSSSKLTPTLSLSCQHYFPRHRRSYSAVVVQDQQRGRARRIFSTVFLVLGSFALGTYWALSYAPPILSLRRMGPMLTNEETLTAYEAPDAFTKEVDDHIKNHKIAQQLRANAEFVESRPHLKVPEIIRHHNLTAGSLMGDDMITVPPYFFNHKDGDSMVCIFYVGNSLNGHPGIVHGGFLATMLDEGLARCAFVAMPNKVGVTAQLNIAYKKPTMANQFLALVATTTKVDGRKAFAKGGIVPLEDLVLNEDGTVADTSNTELVIADALFIEPKRANMLKKLYPSQTA